MAGCPPAPPIGTEDLGPPAQSPRPYFSARQHQVEYAGPEREVPSPQNLEEVRIGYFGPSDAGHPLAGAMWLAATMAIEEANRGGGYEGKPFRLIAAWAENPWGTGISGVTRLVYEEGVWGIVGAPDGPSAHLVEQVVAKARVPFISPVATDKTTNLVNVPWMFSCAPGDHSLAPLLAEAVGTNGDGGDIGLVACTDHDSRVFVTELLTALGQRKVFPRLRLDFRPGLTDFASQLGSLGDEQPAVIVVVAGPQDSARMVSALRGEGLTQPIFGGPAMGHRLFAATAGPAGDGVVFPLLWSPTAAGDRSAEFARRFAERFGLESDYTAAHTYDAVNLMIAAVRQAGLNRARIGDAIRAASPYPGVSGHITWDPTGHNTRPVSLGVVRDGRARSLEDRFTTETREARRTKAASRKMNVGL